MSLEDRERALIRLVEERRDRECGEILDAARAEALRVVDRAYRRERARLHERVLAERADARARIQTARAERETHRRASGERMRERLLSIAWPRLRAVLAERWVEPETRRAWVASALVQARQVLPRGRWSLRHAPGWSDEERGRVARELAKELGAEPAIAVDPGLSAGLAIESDGAVLDASLEALLKDRERIEARLLALVAASAPDAHPDAGAAADGREPRGRDVVELEGLP